MILTKAFESNHFSQTIWVKAAWARHHDFETFRKVTGYRYPEVSAYSEESSTVSKVFQFIDKRVLDGQIANSALWSRPRR